MWLENCLFSNIHPIKSFQQFGKTGIIFYLFIQYFERVSQLANKLFYLAALYNNIYTYIQKLYALAQNSHKNSENGTMF